MPRLRHYDHLGTARFVTFCCYHRYQLLTDSNDIRAVLGCLDRVCGKHDIRILGYVIMPEHVHFVLHPPDEVRRVARPSGGFLGSIHKTRPIPDHNFPTNPPLIPATRLPMKE